MAASTNGVGQGQYQESYTYGPTGNLLTKNGVTYGYSDPAHVHAVTHLTGTVVSSLRDTPYGLPRGETGHLPTPYCYTGQRDTGVGFYDYQARLYDPAVGRFAQADTVVPEAGRPQSLNRYAYALNNPVRYTDPSGHWYYDPGLDAIVTTKEPYNEHPEYLKLGPILPNPQQTFRKQVLSSLLAAGPICQQSAIYIVKNNVEFSFSKQKKHRRTMDTSGGYCTEFKCLLFTNWAN